MLNADWLTPWIAAEYSSSRSVAGATTEGIVPATDERMSSWKSIVALYLRVLVGRQLLP